MFTVTIVPLMSLPVKVLSNGKFFGQNDGGLGKYGHTPLHACSVHPFLLTSFCPPVLALSSFIPFRFSLLSNTFLPAALLVLVQCHHHKCTQLCY